MDCDFDDPASVVSCFIQAMHAWETEAHRLRRVARGSPDPSSYQPSVLASMNEVFGRFCTPKARTHGRDGMFQNPPEYNPESETIVSCDVDDARAMVVTRRDAILGGGDYCYVLHRRANRWLIDSLKFRGENGVESRAVL
jgi:hypothetical protein